MESNDRGSADSLLDHDLQADQLRPFPQFFHPSPDLPGRVVLGRQDVVVQPEPGLRKLIDGSQGTGPSPARLSA